MRNSIGFPKGFHGELYMPQEPGATGANHIHRNHRRQQEPHESQDHEPQEPRKRPIMSMNVSILLAPPIFVYGHDPVSRKRFFEEIF